MRPRAKKLHTDTTFKSALVVFFFFNLVPFSKIKTPKRPKFGVMPWRNLLCWIRLRPLFEKRRRAWSLRFWWTIQIHNQLSKFPSRFRGLSKMKKIPNPNFRFFPIFVKSNWPCWYRKNPPFEQKWICLPPWFWWATRIRNQLGKFQSVLEIWAASSKFWTL